MKGAHKDLPVEEFGRPASGLVEANVCDASGLLPTRYCPRSIKELFLAGTEPRSFCDYHEFKAEQKELIKESIKGSLMGGGLYQEDLTPPELPDIDALLRESTPGGPATGARSPGGTTGGTGGETPPPDGGSDPTWNPLLD